MERRVEQSDGDTAVAKDLAVYAMNSWNQVDGGFRVEHLIGINAGKGDDRLPFPTPVPGGSQNLKGSMQASTI